MTSPHYGLDVRVWLDMLRLQLSWLEREMIMLR